MKFIAHRALFEGPNKALENNPVQIEAAQLNGFDCEVDLWKIDNKLYLGHDEPQYLISEDFLHRSGLWIHAKNIEALDYCNRESTYHLNFFWHETDAYTLTSRGFIWVYPGNRLTSQSVLVMPEMVDPELNNALAAECYAICSDYVDKLRNLRC